MVNSLANPSLRCTVYTIMAYPSKTDRQSIIATAMAILAKAGLRGMSWRSVAAALKLAPNALYRYFDSRQQLETAVAAAVAERVYVALLNKQSARHSPTQAVRIFAVTLLQFADEHQLLYEALLIPRPASGEDAIAPQRLWLHALGLVSRVSGAKVAQEATVALWAFLHGIASLQSVSAFDAEKPFNDSFEFGFQAWLSAATSAGLMGVKHAKVG
jgi:AcrR family transcriptional regulator